MVLNFFSKKVLDAEVAIAMIIRTAGFWKFVLKCMNLISTKQLMHIREFFSRGVACEKLFSLDYLYKKCPENWQNLGFLGNNPSPPPCVLR